MGLNFMNTSGKGQTIKLDIKNVIPYSGSTDKH